MCCEALGLKVNRHWHKVNNTCMLRIAGREFAEKMMRLCGDYAHLKCMRKELREWDRDSLLAFLGGYIAGDGHSKGSRIRCRTASYRLSQDIQAVAMSLGFKSFVNHDQHAVESTYWSEGYQVERTVKSKGSYCVRIDDYAAVLNQYVVGKEIRATDTGDRNRDRIICLGEYMLVPVTEIEHKVSHEEVFNFEVEDDHSYVAYGVIVHNCNKDVTKAKGLILDTVMNKVATRPGFYHAYVNVKKDTDLPAMVRDDFILKGKEYEPGSDEQEMVFDECLDFIAEKHKLERQYLDDLIRGGDRETVKKIWPQSADLSEQEEVITEYAMKSPVEFFCEAFAFYNMGERSRALLPKPVQQRMEETLAQVVKRNKAKGKK
jgi:hypothetical protein